jgi:hypothetical protein
VKTKRSRRIPNRVIRDALERAESFRKGVDNILAVGVGHKYSRRVGYGTRTRVAIKFTVRKKRARVPKAQRIPRWFELRTRNKTFRVPTDVEALGHPKRSAGLGPCAVVVGPTRGYEGTVGPLLKGSDGRTYLLTAGHVLFNEQPTNPWGANALPTYLGSEQVGTGLADVTYFIANGMRVDVGLVRLNAGKVSLFNTAPWTGFTAIASEQNLDALTRTEASRPVLLRLSGWVSSPLATLDQVVQTSLPVNGENYAPFLINSRAEDGKFMPGDSGACVATADGKMLLGLHVLGVRPDASGQDQFTGWSLALCSVIAYLEYKTGKTFTLWTP